MASPPDTGDAKTVVCKIGGSMLYPVGKPWKKTLKASMNECHCSAVVLDFIHVARIDYTGMQVRALCSVVSPCTVLLTPTAPSPCSV
jgi:hypothetical protein